MFGLSLPELLLILAVVVVFFGASKLPELGAGLGYGLKTFRKALSGGQEGEEAKPAPPPEQPPAASNTSASRSDARGL